MEIFINGEAKVVQEGTMISEVIFTILQLHSAGMAIAINDTIVPKQLWDSTHLKPVIKCLSLRLVVGGEYRQI